MEDLQKIINKRAKKRLDDDIKEFKSYVRNSRCFQSISNAAITIPRKDKSPIATALGDLFSGFGPSVLLTRIEEKLLPKYIEEESKAFIDKIESIQSEIDELNLNG